MDIDGATRRYGGRMKTYDFEAVVHDGVELCVGCLPKGVSVNDEAVSPIFADAELDRTVVCDKCGTEHDYMNITGDREADDGVLTEPTEQEALEAALDRFDSQNYGYRGRTITAVLTALENRYREDTLIRVIAAHFESTPELLIRGLREAGMEVA